MPDVRLEHEADFTGWRREARALLEAGVDPYRVSWSVGNAATDLFARSDDGTAVQRHSNRFRVPRAFLTLAEDVVCHADDSRFALLYRLLWRIASEERHLLAIASDLDVHKAQTFAKAVRRCAHKMKAFVRFQEVQTQDGAHFVAWFEPTHYTLDYTAPFFARRFAGMRWSIVTPYRSAHWDLKALTAGPGATHEQVAQADAFEELWRGYYRSIFNPARLKIDHMQGEMPKKYWRNMPETRLIPELIASAQARTAKMVDSEPPAPAPRRGRAGSAPEAVVDGRDAFAQLMDRLRQCRNCHLHEQATQAVGGDGPRDARVMLVGEQPGDREDIEGRPFVGPAGQLLDRALASAKLDRRELYLTNAVKHFKFTPRGKRRIHQSPGTSEIEHCKWWLMKEIELVAPQVIVALGATAVKALLGFDQTLGGNRGRLIQLASCRLIVTTHPSAVLRMQAGAAQEQGFADLVRDLARAHGALVPATNTSERSRIAAA